MSRLTNIEHTRKLKPLTKRNLTWLAVRKREAKRIDTANCDVEWSLCFVADPYDLREELPTELQYTNQECFVSRPGRNIWVWFRDLSVQKQCKLIREYGLKLHPFKALKLN